jgi:hypothetical protein
MKKIAICIFFALITFSVSAQDVKFGIRGGTNLTFMPAATKTPVSEGYSSRIAPAWGIFTELRCNSAISFRFGVEYSGLGGKKDGMQAMPTTRFMNEIASSFGFAGPAPTQELAMGAFMAWMAQNPYYYANVKNTTKFEYITLPLLLQTGWNVGSSPLQLYVNAGPVVSFILSCKQTQKPLNNSLLYSDASGNTTIWNSFDPAIQAMLDAAFPTLKATLEQPIDSSETNITGEMKSANFGIAANVGLRYQSGRNNFFFEVGSSYGFVAVQDNDTNGSNRLGAISMMLGYSFSLF